MKRLTAQREAETKYIKDQNELEISKTHELANIESVKFKQMVDAIGPNTIKSIATAGPEMQVCFLINDYANNINGSVRTFCHKNY